LTSIPPSSPFFRVLLGSPSFIVWYSASIW
jgi:hypothetical protein